MVSTRGAKRKEQQQQECKVEQTENKMEDENCTLQSERKSLSHASQKKSTSSSMARKKKLLELKAAEEKAKLRMEIIDKKLAADLAQLESEGSCGSLSKELSENNEDMVERWLETSQQELKSQLLVNLDIDGARGPTRLSKPAGPQLPVTDPALDDARQPPALGGTDGTVHALASALKDLAAASAANATGCGNKMLNRLCTPRDLPSFSGDPLDWLNFKRAYEESSQVCNFSDRENLWRLRKCLHGAAKEAVTALLIGATSPDIVMSTLELQFGNPDIIISRILQDLNKLRPMAQEYQKDIIPFSNKVKNCVAAVTAIGCEDYLHGMNLVAVILTKLPSVLISKWSDYSFPLISQGTPKLMILSEFLSVEAQKISKTFVSAHSFSKQNYSDNTRNRSQTLLVNNELNAFSDEMCRFCRLSKHALSDCKKFKKCLRKDRWTHVKRTGLCYKCLNSQHKQSECTGAPCDVDGCGRSHHRLLHYKAKGESTTTSTPTPISQPTPSPNSNTSVTEHETVTHLNTNCRKVLLKTVNVYLHGPNGTYRCAAVLDDGSSLTIISESLAARLGLHGNKQTLRVRSAWNEMVCNSEIVDLKLSNEDGKMFELSARRMKNLDLPVQSISADELSRLKLPNPEIKKYLSVKPCQAELLIGQDNYDLLFPLQVIRGQPGDPYFTLTPLGWCVHGCVRSSCIPVTSHQSTFLLSEHEMNVERELQDIHEIIAKSFAIDSLGISSNPRENVLDKQAIEHLERTSKLVDGRWYVGLPWKDECSQMPDSYSNALVRLKGVERKIKSNPEYAERYKERIDHLFRNDYASELQELENSKPKRIWYLPHFGVDNPNKRKLRLVFDASCRTESLNLNSFLLTGPDLLNSLFGIMLRFREYKYALTSDISDMYLRIKIWEEDRHALRFLWRQSPDQPVQTYAMSSLVFGANCSPFVAQFVKNKNADLFKKSMPEASEKIYKQFYVDDYLDSVEDKQLAIKLVNDVTFIHKKGGFELRNWTSSDQSILNHVFKENTQPAVSFKNGQPYDGERTLGLIWFPLDDTLGFDVSFKKIPAQILSGSKKPTKREMLKILMSIYDVYGFLSPITITGKIILQEMWKNKIGWDEEISNQIFTKWINWLETIKNLSYVRLPRHYAAAARSTERDKASTSESEMQHSSHALDKECTPSVTPSTAAKSGGYTAPTTNIPDELMHVQAANACYRNLQLHIFCDASANAMCAVAYWRWNDVNNNTIKLAFVSSKTRVASVKYQSIPRKELQAAVMAARLLTNIVTEHRLKPTKIILWSDSTTVLHWIRNNTRNYKAFISHRLGEIDEHTKITDWRYIPTKMNIADLATRESCEIITLENKWLYGPSFLYCDEEQWPMESDMQHPDVSAVDLECLSTFHVTSNDLPAVPEPERFSSWLRLLRSTSVVLAFIEKCKKVTTDPNRTLMERAEVLLLKYSQMKSFPDDLHNLKHKKALDRTSKLLTLTPFLDADGILRLGGRIDAAPGVPSEVKQPIILDGRCHVARLIVRHYHVKACHGNQEMVVNELKQRYWVIRLRPTVKYISSQCKFCQIKRARPFPPRMGDLPEARLAHHQRPYTYTGCDLFGPLEVTVGRRREKRYGVIFTCLTVRAIHIEIVSQLTTDAFIMALRRMAARRGWPRYLFSDNGTNLKGADTELKRCVQELDQLKLKEEVMNYSSSTTWTFIPPASPHWGGAYERLIRIIKNALKVVLRERAPRDETLHTLMTEVEHMVNSRPLTHVTVEPASSETLTPNHFLLGTSSNLPTLGTFDESVVYLRKQWRISQSLADMFWKRWVKEVLPEMRPRQKWHGETRPLQVGDLVVIVDPNSPRNTWPKGLIEAVFPGKDGRVRVVQVKTKAGVLRRSAVRVALIPTSKE